MFIAAGSQAAASTRAIEAARRHAAESLDKDIAAVQALEIQLEIVARWTVNTPAFEETGKLVSMRQYQRCLDNLEGLVVTRIFELTKMNRSQTGTSFSILSVVDDNS